MIVVGAGECGGRAALALRELGYEGPVTLVGAEPHLPYERPPLSKDAMAAETPAIKAIAGEEELANGGFHGGVLRLRRAPDGRGESCPFARRAGASGV